ncbi:hypothetical protein ABT362_44975 [Nonomuraea rubra]
MPAVVPIAWFWPGRRQRGHGDQEDDWAELYPDRLGFGEPWDGQYST